MLPFAMDSKNFPFEAHVIQRFDFPCDLRKELFRKILR